MSTQAGTPAADAGQAQGKGKKAVDANVATLAVKREAMAATR